MALVIVQIFGSSDIKGFFCLAIAIIIGTNMLTFIITYASDWYNKNKIIIK